MKCKEPKVKFSITLSGWDAAVLTEAVALELKRFGNSKYVMKSDLARRRNWLVAWALRSVFAAMVQKGTSIGGAFGVELTTEDPEVQKLRINYSGGPTGLAENDEPIESSHPRWRWFPE